MLLLELPKLKKPKRRRRLLLGSWKQIKILSESLTAGSIVGIRPSTGLIEGLLVRLALLVVEFVL
jgi:hypothetical protein